MRFRLLTILTLLMSACNSGQNKSNNKEPVAPPRFLLADTADGSSFIAILKLKDLGEPINLTKQELEIIEKLIKEAVKEYNVDRKIWFKEVGITDLIEQEDYLINLKNYKRQYIAYLNETGEREVWINCFCSYGDDNRWKSQIQRVNDGGNCYFNLKINLHKKVSFHFNVNGRA